MAVLVGIVAHGPQDHAGHDIFGGDLADGGALHLYAVRRTFGLDGGLGGAVAHKQVAGGDLAGQRLDPGCLAGSLGSGDQSRVTGVLGEEGRVLGDHVQLRIVVHHGLADHHIPDADLAAHVAGNAGEDDALCAVPQDQHLGGGSGVGLAHTGAAHHHLLARQGALVVLHSAVAVHGHIGQLCTQLVYFVGHCAHNAKDHPAASLLTH